MTLTKVSRRIRRRPQVELLEGRTLLNAGAPDTSFGGTGIVDTIITSGDSYGVAVQPDLKVVVVGQSGAGGLAVGQQITVARYNADGSLDTTFGNGGIVFLPISKLNVNPTEASAVAIQPDGKILVAGDAYVSGTKKGGTGDDWALVRLNPNGSLDTTFGGGEGYVTTAFYNPSSGTAPVYPRAMQIQSNGQIVVAGQATTINEVPELGVVRYNSDGSLDTSFGNGGIALNSTITTSSSGQMLAIDTAGNIDVVGFMYAPTLEMGVARYLPNGTLDPSFGTGGVVGIVPAGSSNPAVHGIALQSTGEIVLCGWGNFGGPSAIESVFVRLNTNGSLDPTFGVGGVYADPSLAETFSIVVQPDDNIVAIGKAVINGTVSPHFWVTRVLANGSSYDPTFGTNGLGEASISSNSAETPYGVALAPDGKIVVTGVASNGSGSVFAAARFLGDPPVTGQLVVTQQPAASLAAGTPFGLTVEAEDRSGNLESSFNGTVTVALANNPGGATLGGTLSETASQGVAAFSGLTLTTAASGYTLLVSASGLGGATTTAITVTPAVPSQVAITEEPPASVTAGSGFGLQATIEDAYGNVVTTATNTVSVALANNPTGTTLGGTLSVTASNGVAAFSGLTLTKAASGYTLGLSSSGLTGATSSAITVTPAAATQVVITQQPPASVVVKTAFGLQASVEDAYGNVVTSASNKVTVALANNPTGAKLGGTLSEKASNGVAAFSDLTLNKVGTGYTLADSSSGLTGATTSPITATSTLQDIVLSASAGNSAPDPLFAPLVLDSPDLWEGVAPKKRVLGT